MPDPDNDLQRQLQIGLTSQPFPTAVPAGPPGPAPDIGAPIPGAPPPEAAPAPDIGAPTPADQSPQTAPSMPQQQPTPQPPKMGGMPLLGKFLAQMIGGQNQRGYGPAAPGQPGKPLSRLDSFEGFLGQFLNAFSQGMAASGHGPGSSIRGAAAAMQAPYQSALQQYGLQQQQRQQETQMAQEQARTAQIQEQTRMMGQMVTIQTPQGPMQMPLALAQKAYPAMVAAQAKRDTARRYSVNAQTGQIYDTFTGTALGGGGTATGGMMTITPKLQEDLNLPQEWVGSQRKISDVNGWVRSQASMMGTVQGAAGPALVNKVKGTAMTLGLGSPGANPIATAKLQLMQAQFERDTFGKWVSQDLLKKYPDLVSLVDPTNNILGWKSPVAPTAPTKQQAEQAQHVQDVLKEIKGDIAAANTAGKLGPIEGRWNEFMVGTVGGDDEQFAKLRSEMSFLASAGLRAHFGARGGQEMYDRFMNKFNSGTMTASDMLGGINGMMVFMNKYAESKRSTATPATPTPAKPGGGPAIHFKETSPGG